MVSYRLGNQYIQYPMLVTYELKSCDIYIYFSDGNKTITISFDIMTLIENMNMLSFHFLLLLKDPQLRRENCRL